MAANDLETIVSVAKRRGFIFPSSEIYGGFRSSYDYGPLGVELKNAIKKLWWEEMVVRRKDVVGLDSAILMNPAVWESSGHTSAGFADELAECPQCHKRWRADHAKGICPECGVALGKARKFNLLVRTHLGPVQDQSTITYFRPETAQGMYVNFVNIQQTSRMKIPFGIAQLGKAFRNEITPGPFTFRTREFEQMEMQFFCRPGKKTSQNPAEPYAKPRRTALRSSALGSREAGVLRGSAPEGRSPEEWFEYWKNERMQWYQNVLAIDKKRLRFHPHGEHELAHYAKEAVDIEYQYPWDWGEFEGIHNRGDFDLSSHAKHSGKDLAYFDEETKERFLPFVIETSGGVDRAVLVALLEHYDEEEVRGEKRSLFRFPPWLAPVTVGVLPIVRNNERIVAAARDIAEGIRKASLRFVYDETGSIGRRYRRLDEAGTPFAITVDFETLENETVTVRQRDSMKQDRIGLFDVVAMLRETSHTP